MSTLKTQLQHTVMAHAIAAAFSITVMGLGVCSSALAQSNATGTIFGQVAATSGVSIRLENTATGVSRVITPDAKGKYQATSMPPGRYQVSLIKNGSVEKTMEVESLIGQGVEASFASESGAQSITVTARRNTIDVSNTNNGVVLTSKELTKLPIAQNLQAVISLAPGTVRNVSGRYGNVSSFGGASASENSYYINGFPVTNILTQVGASELPFGSIAQAQILQGGYSSEFGRSTGGVVNITTKSGTNTWEVGGKISTVPVTSKAQNVYFPNTGKEPATDGQLQFYAKDNTSSNRSLGLYAGGPIVPNKLFIFVAAEQSLSNNAGVGVSSDKMENPSGWTVSKNTLGRYLLKLDYNLSDDHHFEYTHILDESKGSSSSYGFSYKTLTHDNVKKNGYTIWNAGNTRNDSTGSSPGSTDDIFKYTGYLSDDVTLTALFGQSHTSPRYVPTGYDSSIRQVNSSLTTRVPSLIYPSSPQAFGQQVRPDAKDDQQTARLDIEYKLGSHSLRAGLDYNKAASLVGYAIPGGGVWSYAWHKPSDASFKPFGATVAVVDGGGFGAQGFYVSEFTDVKSAAPTTTQSAQYIQDRYQVSDNVLLDLGLRNEQFSNYNNAHQVVISQKNQIAPRLGATWDVNRDGTLKVFANAGRYFMPVPTNLVGNMGSMLRKTTQYFTYTGVDPVSGVPSGLKPISPVVVNLQSNPDARSVSADGIKPFYQDELALGFEKAFSPTLNFGVNATYRTLRTSYEDTCDQRPIVAWGKTHGYPNLEGSNLFPSGCMVINTGIDNDVWIDPTGTGKGEFVKAHLTAAELGYPKVKRTYTALNFFLEHPFRDGWYAKVNYTLSRNMGNTEGQAQDGDVGLSSADFPEQLIHGDGYLPSDRRHVIKAYGFYQITPEIMVGANLQLASGRPRNCMGSLPEYAGEDAGGYAGSNFFFCNVDKQGNFIDVGTVSPRGSAGRLPWTSQVDMNFSYQPVAIKGLNLKLDVFNLFDSHTINTI
ncbi:MAG: TonB-dependent receptor, partial [Undibacterium sp.]|nr:TonB-dependent receptor [Undibacterium sp.]